MRYARDRFLARGNLFAGARISPRENATEELESNDNGRRSEMPAVEALERETAVSGNAWARDARVVNAARGTRGASGGATGGASVRADAVETAARTRTGDYDELERLVRSHGARLLAVARSMLRNEEDARDAFQDALLSALRSVGRYRGAAQLSTWLHRIVVNAALMKLRSRRRRPEEPLDNLIPMFDEQSERADSIAAWRQPPDSLAERAETSAFVRKLIDRLPDTQRTVLLLRDIDGIDTQHVAERLGITPNAVKIRLHRARRALRAILDPDLAAVA